MNKTDQQICRPVFGKKTGPSGNGLTKIRFEWKMPQMIGYRICVVKTQLQLIKYYKLLFILKANYSRILFWATPQHFQRKLIMARCRWKEVCFSWTITQKWWRRSKQVTLKTSSTVQSDQIIGISFHQAVLCHYVWGKVYIQNIHLAVRKRNLPTNVTIE